MTRRAYNILDKEKENGVPPDGRRRKKGEWERRKTSKMIDKHKTH